MIIFLPNHFRYNHSSLVYFWDIGNVYVFQNEAVLRACAEPPPSKATDVAADGGEKGAEQST